jgi:hypothetical protein
VKGRSKIKRSRGFHGKLWFLCNTTVFSNTIVFYVRPSLVVFLETLGVFGNKVFLQC